MKKMKTCLIIIPVVLLLGAAVFMMTRARSESAGSDQPQAVTTPQPKVNLIDIKDRPYVTLLRR
jgi:flagellar basal body-associated protein FliL